MVLGTIKTERERQRDKETESDATPPPTFDQPLPAHTIIGRYINIANLKKKKKPTDLLLGVGSSSYSTPRPTPGAGWVT